MPRRSFADLVGRLLHMPWPEIRTRITQAWYKSLDRTLPDGFSVGTDRTELSGAVMGVPIPALARVADVADAFERGFPDERRRLLTSAEDVLLGKFEILGLGALDLGEFPDWHREPVTGQRVPLRHWSRIRYLDSREVGDSKLLWEINRHQHVLRLAQAYRLSGDPRFAQRAVALVTSWLRANPPERGANWASSLEVAIRAITWCWIWHLLDFPAHAAATEAATVLRALTAHGRHIERYLSTYFSPNTHLTGEALGLCYLATFLSSARQAARWWRLGSEILLREADVQVHPDGLHFERSASYHLYTLDIYLHFCLLCRARGTAIPDGAASALARLATAARTLQRPDGLLPNAGDDDGGSLLSLGFRDPRDPAPALATAAALLDRYEWWPAAPTVYEALWLVGHEPFARAAARPVELPSPVPSQLFDHSGFVACRSAQGDYALVSLGLQRGQSCRGHGHDDALSVELWCHGRPVIVDPGTYTYTGQPDLRRWYRSGEAHNAALIDGRPQPPAGGPFEWTMLRQARLLRHALQPAGSYVEMQSEVPLERETVRHRRALVAWHGVGWVIWDRFDGVGEHFLRLRHQFPAHRDAWATSNGAAVMLGSHALCVWSEARGRLRSAVVDSPVSPRYGRLDPARAWVLEGRVAFPTDVLTVILPAAGSVALTECAGARDEARPLGSEGARRCVVRIALGEGIRHEIIAGDRGPVSGTVDGSHAVCRLSWSVHGAAPEPACLRVGDAPGGLTVSPPGDAGLVWAARAMAGS